MENTNQNTNNLSVGDLIKTLKEYFFHVLRNFGWIFLTALVFGASMGYFAYTLKDEFTADLTFVVDEQDKGGFDISNSIAALGLGGGKSKAANLERIVQLCDSEHIVFKTLLSNMDNSDVLIGNAFIEEYFDEEEKEKLSILDNVEFEKLSREQKRTLRKLRSFIKKDLKTFSKAAFDEDTKIITIRSKSENEDLSYSYINAMYKNLSTFYRRQTVQKALTNVESLQSRKDSIFRVLQKGEVSLAALNDQSTNYLYTSSSLPKYRKQREVEFSSQVYIDVVQNLELARYKLATITPFFSVIDKPYLPLRKEGKSPVITAIIGCALGAFLAILLIIIIKLIKDLM